MATQIGHIVHSVSLASFVVINFVVTDVSCLINVDVLILLMSLSGAHGWAQIVSIRMIIETEGWPPFAAVE